VKSLASQTTSAAARANAWLSGAGLRPTRQRRALAALLVGDGAHRHVTAERLFDAAKDSGAAHAVTQGGHNDLWIRGLGEIILDESQKMTRAAAATANHPITQR